MKKKIFWSAICLLAILSLVFSTFSGVSAVNGNWWDREGEPQYGGTINLPNFRVGSMEEGIDPWSWMNLGAGWHETLFAYDWTLDRDVFSFQSGWVPNEYMGPCLAETWEWKDAKTLVINVRRGVYYHDKPPVNGREFNAHDVQYHFDRMLGKGEFTEPNMAYAGWASVFDYVEATDDYTVIIHFKRPTLVNNMWTVYDPIIQHMEAKEYVDQGDTNKWENAVGTGPFILSEMVSGSRMTLTRFPNYWGYDERHPKNKLPYADELKYICIPDLATEVAALRTHKIDLMQEMNWKQADQLGKTNPDLVRDAIPSWTNPIWFRVDKGPFSDIRVRKAMQLCIDRAGIGKALFNTGGETCGLVPPIYTGFCIPYKSWPADLKAEYGYNPGKAKKLLAEAGYPNGFNTNIVVNVSENMEVMQAIKSYMSEVGVEMEITVMDPGAMGNFINSRKHTGMSAGMGGLGAPPGIGLENAGMDRSNATCHTDRDYQELLERFRNAPNVEAAKKASTEGDMHVMKQHWFLGQVSMTVYNVWQPYLKGYNSECGGQYYGLRGWYWARFWIDQQLKGSM